MRVKISPEQQIQRINELQNSLEVIKEYPVKELTTKKDSKTWSVLEVIKHMSVAQKAYQGKIKRAFEATSDSVKDDKKYKTSAISSFLIKRFPPQEQQIRFKMKTSKQFEPKLDGKTNEVSSTIQELELGLEELKSWVNKYRDSAISLKKFNSAIGPVVRFNIPQACEFILCHNERHFFQIKNILQK